MNTSTQGSSENQVNFLSDHSLGADIFSPLELDAANNSSKQENRLKQ